MNKNKLFQDIESAKSLSDLQKMVERYEEISNLFAAFEKKYPRIDLSITKQDLVSLSKIQFLKNKTKINPDLAKNMSATEKLLLAILWKRGDFNKIHSVVKGVFDQVDANSEYGVIFEQYGRSLVNIDEPIIDQHTLRAFCLYNKTANENDIDQLPRNSTYSRKHEKIINAYRTWFKSLLLKSPERERKEFKYLLDKLMFIVGKLAKRDRE
jgi:hypothetical protein